MNTFIKKNFSSPDEVRKFPKGKLELIKDGNVTIGRFRLEPGWKWTESVKPMVKTESCMIPHTQYVLAGRIRVLMDSGEEIEFGPGDLVVLPPGHQAWVVGNTTFEAIELTGAEYMSKELKAA